MTAMPKLNEVEKDIFHALKLVHSGTKKNEYTTSEEFKKLKLNQTAKMMIIQSGIVTTLGHKRARKYMYTPDVMPNLLQVRRIYGMYQNYTHEVQKRKKDRDELSLLSPQEQEKAIEELQDEDVPKVLPHLSVDNFFELIKDLKERLLLTNPNIHVDISIEIINKTKTKI